MEKTLLFETVHPENRALIILAPGALIRIIEIKERAGEGASSANLETCPSKTTLKQLTLSGRLSGVLKVG